MGHMRFDKPPAAPSDAHGDARVGVGSFRECVTRVIERHDEGRIYPDNVVDEIKAILECWPKETQPTDLGPLLRKAVGVISDLQRLEGASREVLDEYAGANGGAVSVPPFVPGQQVRIMKGPRLGFVGVIDSIGGRISTAPARAGVGVGFDRPIVVRIPGTHGGRDLFVQADAPDWLQAWVLPHSRLPACLTCSACLQGEWWLCSAGTEP